MRNGKGERQQANRNKKKKSTCKTNSNNILGLVGKITVDTHFYTKHNGPQSATQLVSYRLNQPTAHQSH